MKSSIELAKEYARGTIELLEGKSVLENKNCKYSGGCELPMCNMPCCYQELHGGPCYCKKHAPQIRERKN